MKTRFSRLLLFVFLLFAFTLVVAAQNQSAGNSIAIFESGATQATSVYLVALNGDTNFRSLWEQMPEQAASAQASE